MTCFPVSESLAEIRPCTTKVERQASKGAPTCSPNKGTASCSSSKEQSTCSASKGAPTCNFSSTFQKAEVRDSPKPSIPGPAWETCILKGERLGLSPQGWNAHPVPCLRCSVTQVGVMTLVCCGLGCHKYRELGYEP